MIVMFSSAPKNWLSIGPLPKVKKLLRPGCVDVVRRRIGFEDHPAAAGQRRQSNSGLIRASAAMIALSLALSAPKVMPASLNGAPEL